MSQQNADDFARRLAGNGSNSAPDSSAFVSRIAKGGKSTNAVANRLVDALSEKPKGRTIVAAKDKHKGRSLKSDERSLRDGFDEAGEFKGPQQPAV